MDTAGENLLDNIAKQGYLFSCINCTVIFIYIFFTQLKKIPVQIFTASCQTVSVAKAL